MTREDRVLLRERRCYICLRVTPETKGLVFTRPSFIVCHPGCSDRAMRAEYDHSHSKRGKRRPRREFLAILRAMRSREVTS